MEDDINLGNACADLVTQRKAEAFPRHLLGDRRPGEWARVLDTCRHAGLACDDVTPTLVASWLPDPAGDADYSVIVFYDAESQWSLTAHYNRGRLLGRESAGPTPPVNATSLATASTVKS